MGVDAPNVFPSVPQADPNKAPQFIPYPLIPKFYPLNYVAIPKGKRLHNLIF
jgi:hypothetical protein